MPDGGQGDSDWRREPSPLPLRPVLKIVHNASPLPQLERDPALIEEFRSILITCRNDMMAYRDIVLTGRDEIGIHQTRVALRRLRAAISLFRTALDEDAPKDLSHAARELASACGGTRDWDVFLADTLPAGLAALKRHTEDKDVNYLGKRAAALARTAKRLRRTAHDKARAALSGEVFQAFDTKFTATIDAPAPDIVDREAAELSVLNFARGALEHRDHKVSKLGKHLDELPFSEKHRLRVRLKKLRYAAAFLRHAFDPGQADAYIDAAAKLQEALGAINDRAVTHGLLDQLRTAAHPSGAHDWLAGALSGWLVGETDRREARLDKAWRQFRKAPRYWRSAEQEA